MNSLEFLRLNSSCNTFTPPFFKRLVIYLSAVRPAVQYNRFTFHSLFKLFIRNYPASDNKALLVSTGYSRVGRLDEGVRGLRGRRSIRCGGWHASGCPLVVKTITADNII